MPRAPIPPGRSVEYGPSIEPFTYEHPPSYPTLPYYCRNPRTMELCPLSYPLPSSLRRNGLMDIDTLPLTYVPYYLPT